MLHVEARKGMRAEEDGHDDERQDENWDVGDGQTSKQERGDTVVTVEVEHDDRQQVGGDAEQTQRPDEHRIVEEVEPRARVVQPVRRPRRVHLGRRGRVHLMNMHASGVDLS